MINSLDMLLFIALCSVPIGLMIVLLYCMRRDSKAYQEALKEYLTRSVDDGYNAARRKNVRNVSENRK